MMAGNPNCWGINNVNGVGMHPHEYQLSPPPPPLLVQFPANSSNPNFQDFPVRSWSQLLLGGDQEERFVEANLLGQEKKLENWEDQVANLNVKEEMMSSLPLAAPQSSYGDDDEFQAVRSSSSSSNGWPTSAAAVVSSPTSCITNSILNFSSPSPKPQHHRHAHEHSPEENSNGNSRSSCKKARVHHSSAQPALKVRKEKLGDRITALHQLVSPFGKTDTASVLSEAIGYIRFLQAQIQALSSPYMRNATASSGHHQHSVLNGSVDMERAAHNNQDYLAADLRSRGLCLVPISCTQHMPTDGGAADYWPPTALGTGF
ncbi:transcription factor bHLH68-like isoform X2 [Andrographis paniculata]|uniref:transcription factor bHLH68-like isoform X2 n=1 Tax=Andrographis paniculata TaxID=175694 RepID=UPI0021E8B4B4|nr:transcription factor bHLH68-like isoform X2 [Andrographis paniculata]